MTLRFNEQQQDLSQPCLERESEENTSTKNAPKHGHTPRSDRT